MTSRAGCSGGGLSVAGEYGAVLVQVSIAITALCGFSALAVDYGMLMNARGQAQAAADAGALAGAIELGFDDFEPADFHTTVSSAARAVATANQVMGQPPDVTGADVVSVSTPLEGFPPPPVARGNVGVTVSVYRTQSRNNPLPTFFGRLVGINGQSVRAQATAMIVPANATDCAWPLAIADRWTDHNTVLGASVPTFVKYIAPGPPAIDPNPDLYTRPSFVPPNQVTAGSGLPMPVNLKVNVHFTLMPAVEGQPIGVDQFVAVQIPRDTGVSFADSLASCNRKPVIIGQTLLVEGAGNAVSLLPAIGAALSRYNADPIATWNPTSLRVENSCAADPVPCAAISPRLIVLPVFDPDWYDELRWDSGAPATVAKVKVVNFFGFFITHVGVDNIEGQLTTAPGRVIAGEPMVGYESAFLRTAILTR
jgi:Flp pilus assembly protein TadG